MDVKIGLEVHVQITSLKSKLFCSCSADYRGKPPNTNVCPVCLGLPGALPVVNKEAIRKAILTALALNCSIERRVIFSRKHYFYPDLPKNYQITQYDGPGCAPIARNGFIDIETKGYTRRIRIRRINIEEDPGRIVYPTGNIATSPYVLVDYNRSGIALLEIVTEPDMKTPQEARAFLEKLRSIIEHLGVADCSLEGAMRVDANISIEGGGRVEIKNIGSIKDVERALSYEILRQKTIMQKGETVKRETRHWDPDRKVTFPARIKEEEADYRYFPDPDLPPLMIDEEEISKLASEMPELPDARAKRFMEQYGLPEYDAKVLVMSKALADFFEDCAKLYHNYKMLANILINDYLRWIYENDLSLKDSKATPEKIAALLEMLDAGTISIKILKQILPKIILEGKHPREIIESEGLTRISDREFLARIVDEVFREKPKAVNDALRKPKAIEYLVGQVMKKTRGRADPGITRELILEKLRAMKGS